MIVAELLGHARLETIQVYTRPTAEDRAKALELLPVYEWSPLPMAMGPLPSSIAPFALMWVLPLLRHRPRSPTQAPGNRNDHPLRDLDQRRGGEHRS